jgi:hypothetical protein
VPEHEHVVGLVADRGDAVHGDLQVARQPLQHHALVGGGWRDVEVVRLRARRGDQRPEALLDRGFAGRDAGMVLADADDLHHAAEDVLERGDDDRVALDRSRLAGDARSLQGSDVPIGRSEEEDVQAVGLDHVDQRGQQVVRQHPLVEDRQVRKHDDAAVERRHRHRQAERLDERPHPERGAPAGDGEDDPTLAQGLDRPTGARGQNLVLGHQGAVDVREDPRR